MARASDEAPIAGENTVPASQGRPRGVTPGLGRLPPLLTLALAARPVAFRRLFAAGTSQQTPFSLLKSWEKKGRYSTPDVSDPGAPTLSDSTSESHASLAICCPFTRAFRKENCKKYLYRSGFTTDWDLLSATIGSVIPV